MAVQVVLVLVVLVAVVAGYAVGVGSLRRRGRRWPPWRLAAWCAGTGALWVALGSSAIAGRDDTNVAAHLLQHLLLMMVGPPMLVLGRPLVLLSQSASRRMQSRINRLLRSGAVAVVTSPWLTWPLYLGSMYVMITDRSVYDYLILHPVAHHASHLALLTVGCLYWQPLLDPGVGRRPSDPARILAVMANMPFEVLVGLWVRFQGRPLGPGVTLAGTHRGGELFVVGATMTSTVWLAVIVVQAARTAWREEKRGRRRLATGDPTAWSVPWWVEAGLLDHPAGEGRRLGSPRRPPGPARRGSELDVHRVVGPGEGRWDDARLGAWDEPPFREAGQQLLEDDAQLEAGQ